MSSHFIALIKSTLSLNILMQRRQKQNLFCGKDIRLGFKATRKSSAERMSSMENCPFHGKKINGLLMKGTNSTRGNIKTSSGSKSVERFSGGRPLYGVSK